MSSDLDLKKVMDRIRKCLALGKSDNPNEAAAAMRRAKMLMDKHGLSAVGEDVFAMSSKETRSKNAKHPMWEAALASTVGQAFGCTAYLGYFKVVFVGPSGAADVASYTFQVLLRQLGAAKSIFFDERPWLSGPQKRKQGKAFAEAWVLAVAKKVDEFAEEISASAAASHKAYAETSDQYRVSDKAMQRKSALDSSDYDAMSAGRRGFAKGSEVVLMRPINAGEDQQKISGGQA